MIISHKHRFIYIKTQKTGGTSLELALSRFCGPDDAITPLDPEDEVLRIRHGGRPPQKYTLTWRELHMLRDASKYDIARLIYYGRWPKKYHAHMNAARIRQWVGDEVWKSYLKFAIVRNPYDRALSLYNHEISRGKFAGTKGFKNFIRKCATEVYQNWEIYTEDDRIAVDRVIRYENLGADAEAIGSEIGLDQSLESLMQELSAKAGLRKYDTRKPSQLDPEEQALLYYLCRPEIEAFGYTPADSRGSGP